MRKFAFVNDIGERIDLNGGDIFFNAPTGLGYQTGDKFADLGEGFFNLASSVNKPQAQIVGEIVFLRLSYMKYNDLISWVERNGEFYLTYSPENTEYYRRVRLVLLTKKELEHGRWLRAPVTLNCLTPWFTPTPLELTFSSQNTRYPFTYNRAIYTTNGSKYTVRVPARGHLPTALNVKYTGKSQNLTIILTGMATGKEYGRCALNCNSMDGETIELCTQPRNSFITRNGVDLIMSNNVDINFDPFFRAPCDEQSELRLLSDEPLDGEISAQAFFYYRSV